MDWKDAEPKLDELASRAQDSENEVNLVVSHAVTVIAEQLDHVHKFVSHLQDRLDALESRLASLEARVHEDVE